MYPIGQFQLLPMMNLSKFTISSWTGTQQTHDTLNFKEFWGAIQSIDYGVNIPTVEEIGIWDRSGTLNYSWPKGVENNEGPVSNTRKRRGAVSSYSSARKL